MGLEEREPEYLGVYIGREQLTDGAALILVDDVLEVHQVEIIGPWMQDGEASVAHVLKSESFNFTLNEAIGCLERYHRVL